MEGRRKSQPTLLATSANASHAGAQPPAEQASSGPQASMTVPFASSTLWRSVEHVGPAA
jgi:hypothetical protein